MIPQTNDLMCLKFEYQSISKSIAFSLHHQLKSKQKQERLEKDHMIPDLAITPHEKALIKIATRGGTVQLTLLLEMHSRRCSLYLQYSSFVVCTHATSVLHYWEWGI